MHKVTIPILSLLVLSCGTPMTTYNKSDIQILAVNKLSNGTTELVVQPKLETLYFFPGVQINKVGERNKLKFLRCGIKDKCQVDQKSELAGGGSYKVMLSGDAEDFDLDFAEGESALSSYQSN